MLIKIQQMQQYADIYSQQTTLHVSGVTAPIIRGIKNCTRSLRYRPYYLYRYSPPTWSDRDAVPIREETAIQHTTVIPSQAKPSQSVNWGRRLARSASRTSPCLLAIPAIKRNAGLTNRFLNSNRVICLR